MNKLGTRKWKWWKTKNSKKVFEEICSKTEWYPEILTLFLIENKYYNAEISWKVWRSSNSKLCGNRGRFSGSSLMLTRGKGNVCILDKYMWFGEDDDDNDE